MRAASSRWPELRFEDWEGTLATLHLWTQIVGKVRLRLAPFVNHWWHVTLYVTSRGLTTGTMPYGTGRSLSIEFDFLNAALLLTGCDGESARIALEPMSVASFYARLMEELRALHFDVRIHARPNEVAVAIPFAQDEAHASYDNAYALRFWRVLLQADRLFNRFRGEFLGKASPVHFFWGSFDLALSLFSGRDASLHPGGFPNMPDSATREAYSREEYSCGFWPGGSGAEALFYAYAYPQPERFEAAPVRPESAQWSAAMREFVLPYEAVRTAADPDRAVIDFLNSTYGAAADRARWDRATLERLPPTP